MYKKQNVDKVILEFKEIIQTLGHFPKQKELLEINRSDLIGKSNACGGLNKIRKLMGYDIEKLQGYWTENTEEKCVDELQKITQEIGHFPLYEELRPMGKGGLAKAISKSGGINKYHELLNIPYNCMPNGYWTKDNCILEIKKVIEEVGHFPTQKELIDMGKQALVGGITKNNGLTAFREYMGYKIDKLPDGYWTEEKCIEELDNIINTIKYFPSQLDLILTNRTDIMNAVRKFGGLVNFRDIMGYHLDRSSSSKYNIIRGKNTENVLFDILSDYCKQKEIPLPIKNVKLAHKNVIEFVCINHRTIGIDITTTHSTTVVHRKWREKDYYKYLDELWIVVVSDTFKQHHYDKWNNESPENVYVMSIDEFCKELEYDLEETIKNKIEKYKVCTFHSKNHI